MVQPSPEPRRASSTTRMASTPAAMAAAIGSRDGSGPMSGTGAGPETGLVAVATVDFACAAASFAADARSPLVSASPAAAGVFLGGAFSAGASWRLSSRAPPSSPPWRVSSRRGLSSPAPSSAPWPVASSPGVAGSSQAVATQAVAQAVGRSTQRRSARMRVEQGSRRGAVGSAQPAAAWTADLRRVGPAGLTSGCSFAVACLRVSGSGPHHARSELALPGGGQSRGQGKRDSHHRQFGERTRSGHHGGGAVGACGGQP